MKRPALCSGLMAAGLVVAQGLYGMQETEPPASERSVELGAVNWNRDWSETERRSAESGKPILVLFQEVPG